MILYFINDECFWMSFSLRWQHWNISKTLEAFYFKYSIALFSSAQYWDVKICSSIYHFITFHSCLFLFHANRISVAPCPNPDIPVYGKIKSRSSTAAEVECLPGYETSDNTRKSCVKGSWVDSKVTCKRKYSFVFGGEGKKGIGSNLMLYPFNILIFYNFILIYLLFFVWNLFSIF